jgi:hypothetical protein
VPAIAAAQPYVGAGSRGGRMEVSGAAAWTGGYDDGVAAAEETRNPTTGSSPLTLFNANGSMQSGFGFEGRLGYYLSSRVSVEGIFQYTRPTLHVRLSNDFENADPVDAETNVSTYIFGGSVLYHFGSGSFVPFVLGGAGYVRQLEEAASDATSGLEVHGGGGIKYWFGAAQRVGLRADAQISSRSKSVGFEDKRRVLPSVAGGIVVLF